MVSLIWEIYSTGKSSFQIISYRTILRLEQLQQRNPDATKEGGREKKKKEKPLDRSSTKGFSSSQSLNLTSQTKWIPFAWLLVGPLWWWKRIECIWWKTNVLLKMSGNHRNFCLEFKSYVFQSRVGIGIYQKYKKIQKFRILKSWKFQSRNFNTTKSQKLSVPKS